MSLVSVEVGLIAKRYQDMTREQTKLSTPAGSPFHRGEQYAQTRLGIRDKMENIGRRLIRPSMPDQHRAFYEQLPFLMVGSADAQGRPWASILTGSPNFVTSPDEVTLNIQTQPLPGDPLNDGLHKNADIGLLGIDLETRRRNRVNGKIEAISADGFSVAVSQSFGNCPQYIQTRQLEWLPERPAAVESVQRLTRLTSSMLQMIAKADTLFIATRFAEGAASLNQGIDVSHRGGKPGFVRIEEERTFIFPNFSGNSFYNTLGNLVLVPRVGILVLNFEAGHLLSITGHADVVWEGKEVQAFQGAEQLVRITADEIVYLPAALPFRWSFREYSPTLELTGDWRPSAA